MPGLPPGVAMTNRTFRYLAEPRFPEGIDTYPPGPFSILNETDVRTVGAPLPASAFRTPQGFDAFNRRDQDAFLALMDDEVEAHSRIVAVEERRTVLRRSADDTVGSSSS